MQDFSPLVASDFLAKVKRPRYKFEIHVGAAWVNLCDLNGVYYLKTINVNPSGAGATPDVIAGTWSAEIANPGGIFHPLHPTSDYADYFRIGREVRISIGGNLGGADRYYQRLIGYMDAPKFNHKSRSVSLSGCDYSKRLADTIIRASPLDQETINGPSHWGKRAIFDTVVSYTPIGSERYALNDALKPGFEYNSINANWQKSTGAAFVVEEGGPPYLGAFSITYGSTGWLKHLAVVSLTQDKRYIVKFRFYSQGGDYQIELAQTAYERRVLWSGDALPTDQWVEKEVEILAWTTDNLEFHLEGSNITPDVPFYLDWISIKESLMVRHRYPMPEDCNGPWNDVLLDNQDGEGFMPVWQGDTVDEKDDTSGGWFYNEPDNEFYFDEKKVIREGTANLRVYYYTTQNLDNVTADLLVAAGYYADRAAALAAMDYTPTGLTIPRVWFEPDMTALAAVKLICERCNYRFWFAYDGTPCFKPASVAGSPVFSFPSFGDLSALDDKQDLEQIRNRIVIEGIEQAMYTVREDKKTSRFTGTASDTDSIDAYLEHTETIQNPLFQDQATIDAMCATLLAERKDPKWYATLNVPNPVPLEVGDTISWFVDFATVQILSGGSFLSAPVDDLDGGTFLDEPDGEIDGGTFLGSATLLVTGIIRAIGIGNSMATYTCEITDYE